MKTSSPGVAARFLRSPINSPHFIRTTRFRADLTENQLGTIICPLDISGRLETLINGENIMATAVQRRLVRTKEAATYLSMSEWKLRRLIQDGTVPFVQDNQNAPFLLDVRDLDAYIESNKHSGADLINMPPLPAVSSRGEARGHSRRVG